MFLKPRRPKNLRFKPAGKINFDLTQQKKQTVALETKDSSSADHYLPNNKVRGWPPQNDKP
jgi:hypothetical protein